MTSLAPSETIEFRWFGTIKEDLDQLSFAAAWRRSQGSATGGIRSKINGYYSHRAEQREYCADVERRVRDSGHIPENELVFRDLAEEQINNVGSMLPYLARAAQRHGQNKDRAQDRTLAALRSRYGKLTRRIYELVYNGRSTGRHATLKYFLTDEGICIPAQRMIMEHVGQIERRVKSYWIDPAAHVRWLREEVLQRAVVPPDVFEAKNGIMELSDLILNPVSVLARCASDGKEYDIITSKYRSSPDGLEMFRDFLILKPPLSSMA